MKIRQTVLTVFIVLLGFSLPSIVGYFAGIVSFLVLYKLMI